MKNPIKFNTKDGRFLFTSDLHHNHDRDFIYIPYGYSSVEEMNQKQIQTWNECVGPHDTVFHLGDIIFNDPTGDKLINLINQLNFKKLYLLLGNHTSGIKHLFDDDSGRTIILNGREITLLGNYAEIIIDHQLIVLCHYPFAIWRDCHKGSWNLQAHTHGNYKRGLPNNFEAKILDVGWGVFKRPVDFFEIKSIMDKKGAEKLDHH